MTFADEMKAALKPGFVMPDALLKLYQWIEANRFVETYPNGGRFGTLAPLTLLEAEEPIFNEHNEEIAIRRGGGSGTVLAPDLNEGLHYWFGLDEVNAIDHRVCVFARTGGDGSMAALWLDDEGVQHIVHMGSGSGSLMTCVLASNPVDFLRLNAIGYDEICWDEFFDAPPNADWEAEGLFVEPYRPFQDWVKSEFGVTIPKTAREIVKLTPSMQDEEPTGDPFHDWTAKVVG
tara:strand:- start:194263 stop:194961 length:699 start_codon:yes stop_codon:yes gene_type:complete